MGRSPPCRVNGPSRSSLNLETPDVIRSANGINCARVRRQLSTALCDFVFAALVLSLGCRTTSGEGRAAESRAAALRPPETEVRHEAPSRRAPLEGQRSEVRPPADPLERLLPPEHPPQRLAFSRYRLAALIAERLVVRRLGDLEVVADVPVPDGRNVTALVGGGFLVLGRDHVQRLSGIERRAELLPRAPRLGPTTLIASAQESEQFWLHYEGIPQLAAFDLSLSPLGTGLPVRAFIELPESDHRALLGQGDGGFVYTTAAGLARIDAGGRHEMLPAPELGGQVWRLARTARRDQVWAATLQHVYRVGVRGAATVLERRELPPHPLALASSASGLGVLSVEGRSERALRLRIDVFPRGSEEVHVLRFDAGPEERPDGGAGASFAPELALAPERDLLAVHGYGLHIFDWRRQRRLYPP